jgi:hypothetical protein
MTTLVIIGDFWQDLDWELLLPEWRVALYDLMAQPQISFLKLCGMANLDLIPIANFGRLNRLSLKRIGILPDTSLEDGAPFPLPPPLCSARSNPRSLQSLHIGTCGEALALLLCTRNNGGSLDLSRITELSLGTFRFDEEEMADPWKSLLGLCCKSLQKYRIIHEVPRLCLRITPFHPSFLDLKRFPNLVDFSILLNFKGFAADDSFPTPQVLAAFDELSGSSYPISLATIKIEFKFDVPDATSSFYPYVSKEIFWGNLDGVLARPAFARLKELWIDFYFGMSFLYDDDWPKTSSIIWAKMPQCHQKGIMKLTTE